MQAGHMGQGKWNQSKTYIEAGFLVDRHVVTARIGRQDMDIIQNGSRVLVPLRILEQNIMAHVKRVTAHGKKTLLT